MRQGIGEISPLSPCGAPPRHGTVTSTLVWFWRFTIHRARWFPILLLCLPLPTLADLPPLNLTRGVTPISKEVYDLHMIVLYVIIAIAVAVFSVLFYSIWKFRKSRGAAAAHFHHNTVIEIVWTIIPFLILVGLAIPATKTLIHMEATQDTEMTIKITGYQWWWEYEYMDEGFSFPSRLAEESQEARQKGAGVPLGEHYLLEVDNPLVLPVHTKIRLLTTAADVLHAWWVPDLGWKRDAVPGFINDNWTYIEEPGVYRGQCAELCGRDHGFMPIVVKALPKAEYMAWVQEQKADFDEDAEQQSALCAGGNCTREELMTAGERLYNTHCALCHQVNGEGLGIFPGLIGSPIVQGPASGHIDIVLQGKNAMPAFAGRKDITDAELAAIITYERNAWGNDVGDLVQPAEVVEKR